MNDKIVNRVAKSNLITIDLSDYSPKQDVMVFDVKDFLFEGVILKEKDFRTALKKFNFAIYSDKIVAISCSVDSIIPMWAYMLITSHLKNISKDTYFGTKEEVLNICILKNIEKIDVVEFQQKKVVVKGCGDIKFSESLYIAITNKLQNSVKSLMFGEACSAVPVLKKK